MNMISPTEQERIAVHEAGHVVCSYLLGGTVIRVTLGKVGVEVYAQETENTCASSHCEFEKPIFSEMKDVEEYRFKLYQFWKNMLCQLYSGYIAEVVVYQEFPNEGHVGDFQKTEEFIPYYMATLNPEPIQYSSQQEQAHKNWLLQQTRDLLNAPKNRYAILELAQVLLKRKHLEGVEATEIIRAALEPPI